MDSHDYWEKAVKQTEIVRSRVKPLSNISATRLPYIFLAESCVNIGDTVVRKGEVLIEKPSIILPSDLPQFEGFESEKDGQDLDPNGIINLLLVRGVRFPSMRYNNKTHSLDIFEKKLSEAMTHYLHLLEREENVSSGLLIGPEDCWQFSVLIFILNQVSRQADQDIQQVSPYSRASERPLLPKQHDGTAQGGLSR